MKTRTMDIWSYIYFWPYSSLACARDMQKMSLKMNKIFHKAKKEWLKGQVYLLPRIQLFEDLEGVSSADCSQFDVSLALFHLSCHSTTTENTWSRVAIVLVNRKRSEFKDHKPPHSPWFAIERTKMRTKKKVVRPISSSCCANRLLRLLQTIHF